MEFSKIKKNIIVSVICIFLLLIMYILINFNELILVYSSQKEAINKSSNMEICLGGEAVGIKLLATGVLIMGVDRDDTNLQIGDVILSVNNEKIDTNSKLLEFAKKSNGNELQLKINRKNEIIDINILPILDELSKEYKLGLWVKDSSAGVGTITFYEKKSGKFAALGHAVTETKENYILQVDSGGITNTNIYSIKKGVAKVPGELKGTITTNVMGDIAKNTEVGVFGFLKDKTTIDDKNKIEIMPKTEIREGEASIFCTLDNNKKSEYKVKIQKVLLTSSGNKNMIIQIIDEELLNKTGGIIQGMSGSPIVQDGKLIGAVTHVFLNDPTRGYGVFVENMINDMADI